MMTPHEEHGLFCRCRESWVFSGGGSSHPKSPLCPFPALLPPPPSLSLGSILDLKERSDLKSKVNEELFQVSPLDFSQSLRSCLQHW